MATLTPKIARAFAAARSKFFVGVTANLLKVSETSNEFEEVGTLTDWFFEWSDYRQNFLLEEARDSAGLTAQIAEATHVSIGTDVYIISQADTLPPKGTDFTWKLYCTRFFNTNQFRPLY